jgi:sugar lactone lactonase YvrE
VYSHNFFAKKKERMKLTLVLAILLSVLGKAFSQGVPPTLSTIYSGSIAPAALWSDADGNIYGCEPAYHSVFKITGSGARSAFAGTRGTSGVATEGVLAVTALFNTPRTVWGDGEFLYVTDSVNNRIRRISWTSSLINTIVGGGAGAIPVTGELLGTSVALTLPNAMAGSSNGKVYFADFDHVYMLNPKTGLVGMVSFIAGGGNLIGTFAHGDRVSLSDVQGLAVDPTNSFLFVADSGNKVVRKMDLRTGKSIGFAGRVNKENYQLPTKQFENGEVAYKVTLGNPTSVWVDNDGHVFIVDSLFHTISVVRHDKMFLFAGKWPTGAVSNTLATGAAAQVDIEASYIFGDSNKGLLYLSDTRGGIQKITSLAVNVYSSAPTVAPTASPTYAPTTASPTYPPTYAPSTISPTYAPTTVSPTYTPTTASPTYTVTNPPTLLFNYHFDSGDIRASDNQIKDYETGTFRGATGVSLPAGHEPTIDTDIKIIGTGSLQLQSANKQYITIPNLDLGDASVAGITFSFWINSQSNPINNAKVFDFGNGYFKDNIQVIHKTVPTGQTAFVLWVNAGPAGGSGYWVNEGVETYFPLNTWYHFAWTISPTGVWKTYYNGILRFTYPNGNVPRNLLRTGLIGKSFITYDEDTDGGAPYANDHLDEFRVFPKELSAAEVVALATPAP